jgi:hypothetical protein
MTASSIDEGGSIRRDPISADDLSSWASAYQKQLFPRFNPSCQIKIADDAGGQACFDRSNKTLYIEKAVITSEKLSRILLLHEMIHINLIEENGDPDEAHGDRFQAEIDRLFEAGAYKKLL